MIISYDNNSGRLKLIILIKYFKQTKEQRRKRNKQWEIVKIDVYLPQNGIKWDGVYYGRRHQLS